MGFLFNGGVIDVDVCVNWDCIWSVCRYEIEVYFVDFVDNGIIDIFLFVILEWLGKGNFYFEEVFGFFLFNDEYGFVFFVDIDGDGLYDFMVGDYLALEEVVVIFE